jgi:hypothetical protein
MDRLFVFPEHVRKAHGVSDTEAYSPARGIPKPDAKRRLQ